MKTSATMFSGGDLFGVGAMAAGYTPIWGIEYDNKIASVARLNGFPVVTGDVCDIFSSEQHAKHMQRPDHLHASPPCPNFSIAKADKKETELDIRMAESVCFAIRGLLPDTFTLENVVGYRRSESFKRITRTLSDLGYWWDATNLNSADFGVPQSRHRLFIRASRVSMLRPYPDPVPWKGWFSAIEDLIPDLPDAEFAPWQIARLPEEYKSYVMGQGTYSSPVMEDQPIQTITSNHNQAGIKAFIFAAAGNTNFKDASPGKGVRYEDEPSQTITADGGCRVPKAFIMQVQGESGKGFREEEEVMQTLTAVHSAGKYKAFVLDGQANKNGESVTIRDSGEPIFTQTASADRPPIRAFVGRVVKMNIKALGRFQTVPDTYKGLTVKINGNGVPCLLAQRVLESMDVG